MHYIHIELYNVITQQNASLKGDLEKPQCKMDMDQYSRLTEWIMDVIIYPYHNLRYSW